MTRFPLCAAVVLAVSSCSVQTSSYGPEGSSSWSSSPVSGDIGDRCTTDYDCGGSLSLCVKGVPGGYCTQDCSQYSCPGNSLCVLIDGASACMKTCSAPGRASACDRGMCHPLRNSSSGYCL